MKENESRNGAFLRPRIPKSTQPAFLDFADDNPDFKRFRIGRMLDYINIVDGEYEKWLDVGFALFNEGMELADWENWSRTQPEFKEGECEAKWKGFKHDPNGISIASLYQWAVEGGYNEKETRSEWFQLHPEFSPQQKKSATQMDELKNELRSVSKQLADLNAEKKAALETLRNVEKFDSDTVFSDDVIKAAAFAKLFDKQTYSNFKRDVKLYGDKHPTEKASVNDWGADVKTVAEEISTRQSELKVRINQIQAQITSFSFIKDNDLSDSSTFPDGYSVSAKGGIVKVDGEKIIQVCRRPVIIKEKSFSVEDGDYYTTLAYMTDSGKWETLPAIGADIIANKNKIVDLAKKGLPVTSSNSTHLVDFLDAFNALNGNNCPLTYTVPRCGWYHFDGKECFIDPRRKCFTNKDDKKVSIKVDSLSQFAKSLISNGSLKEWKKVYKLAKKSPVARLILAAAVAPILLQVLNERNFLVYICAPTRAGKTTALYLGASAVGDEKMIRSFDATKNGLAGAAADLNDYAFLVDEKQVADNRLKEAFDNLVYALANGLGRTKLNKDSTLKKMTDWRTIAVMTGETHLLADNVTGGANTRLLSINAPKEILSTDDCKTIRNIIKDHHGLAFPLVIEKVMEVGKKKLRELYNDLVDSFTTAYPELLNEYCRYMAVITLADALLAVALSDTSDQDTQEELPAALEDAKLNAKEIFKLLPTMVEISDTAREREFVLGFMAQNQSRFIGGNIPLNKMQAIYGEIENNFDYITARALKEACEAAKFDYRKLVEDLVAEGFFVPSNRIKKGCKTPLKTVQHSLGNVKNVECYRVKKIDVYE